MEPIKIELLSGLSVEINIAKISAMMLKKTLAKDENNVIHEVNIDGETSERYSVLVDGRWFTVKDEEEYKRVRQLWSISFSMA